MGPFNARPVCRTLQLVLILLTGTITMAAQTPAPTAPLSGQKYVPGHVLVKFRPGVRVSSVQAAHQAVLGQVVRTFPGVEGLELVRLAPGGNLSRALKAYRGNANVLYAEPDYVVHASQTPTDPLFPQMWGLRNTGQTGGTIGADIHATQAWNITTGSSSVVVAVIDTGIDYTHPDLAANVFSGPICAGGTICHGFNAITGADPNDPLDDNGHGTHVSGTIGAIGSNSLGVTGVNWNVKILPCKFLDSQGFGSASGAIACLDFIKNARDSGVNVVASNNSWGGGLFSQALRPAILPLILCQT